MHSRQLDVDVLPPELWQHVLEHLPHPDQRSCRLISHAFHGLATSLVFARVVVNFGDWDLWDKFDRHEEENPAAVELAAQKEAEQSAKSLGILESVVENGWFAGMVRCLEVHAFEIHERDTTLMGRLTNAIRSLRNLHSFVWHGEDPSPSLDLIITLSTSSTSLRLLSLPMKCLPSLPLTAFRSLHTISVTSAEYTLELIEHTLSAQHCTMPMPYMHTVQLPYSVPSDIPISCLPNLTHLELVAMHSYIGLGALLRRVPQLRALALFSPVHDQGQIFAELAGAKSDVPHLAALALQGPSPRVTVVSPAELTQLCDFLRDRAALRRLYFTFEIATEGLGVYLKTIATLKNMEIFDLRMQDQHFDRAFLAGLAQCLPASLSAMKLTSAGLLEDKDAFTDFWAHFTSLGFLYVRTWEAGQVTVDDVIRGAHRMELVGYNGLFHDVRYEAGARAVAQPPWPPRKTALRGVDDFGCDGWEWLMRHLTIVP
ncbi:hypothetical protein DAEQUDRAFT_733822 [Daedalea quercina L-15889]|uniref:F-box domain-containing protein n=1 Tax=Daedalea quercina L-15889 TaxID=1314783 RepID=A0A165KQA8_9APHY|nr:hypothetical protein DAEQUDRAFT_733822 [Daedalea quercina L-15889]